MTIEPADGDMFNVVLDRFKKEIIHKFKSINGYKYDRVQRKWSFPKSSKTQFSKTFQHCKDLQIKEMK